MSTDTSVTSADVAAPARRSFQDQPSNSFRIVLELSGSRPRIDVVLLEALRQQDRNAELKNISRTVYKDLFKKKRVRIKGQSAVPSSSLAGGQTSVDIIGYEG